MVESLFFFGSYATVWLVSWLLCALALAVCYPMIRTLILKWHPAPASALLLVIFSIPLLLSLCASTLLFIPELEADLVTEHCHIDCQAHVPELSSIWMASAGLLTMTILFGVLLLRLLRDLKTARLLHNQLATASQKKDSVYILDDSRPIVFTLGWWKNNIYMTTGLIAECRDRDLNIILAHERAHSQRRDNMRLLFARLVLLILPSSLAKKCYEDLHVLSESACDFSAAKTFGSTNVAETLLKIQRLSMRYFEHQGRTIVSEFNGAAIEVRIQNLLNDRPHSKAQELGLRLFVIFLVILSFALVDPLHRGIEMIIGA